MVTIISNEDLEALNNGKAVNLEFGPLGVTLASEKWVERMGLMGNIKDSESCDGCTNNDKNDFNIVGSTCYLCKRNS